MAGRNYSSQFRYSFHTMPVEIDLNVAIGSTGAVGTVNGPGVTSVTRLGVGTYQVKLMDNYNKLFGGYARMSSGVTGSNVTAGAFVVGTTYVITALGTTNWTAIGLAAGLTAAVGMSFVATGVGTGTGTAKVIAPSGIVTIEMVGDPNLMLNPLPQQGAVILVTCLGSTGAGDTTLIPKDPANGSVMYLDMYLSNSSVSVQGG